MKKYERFAEICSQNLENRRYLVYHPSNNGHVTDPIADKVSKIVLKVVQEDFDNTCKNHIDCICRFFTNFSSISGSVTTPQITSIVNSRDFVYISSGYFLFIFPWFAISKAIVFRDAVYVTLSSPYYRQICKYDRLNSYLVSCICNNRSKLL